MDIIAAPTIEDRVEWTTAGTVTKVTRFEGSLGPTEGVTPTRTLFIGEAPEAAGAPLEDAEGPG